MANESAASGPRRGPKVNVLIELAGAVPASSSSPLPVTIRELSTRTIAKGITGEKLSVAPGEYLVVAELPDGETLVEQVQIDENTGVVALMQSKEQADPDVTSVATVELSGTTKSYAEARPGLVPTSSTFDAMEELATMANAPGEDTSAMFARKYRAIRSEIRPIAFDTASSQDAGHIVQLSPAGKIIENAAALELHSNDKSLASIKVRGANRAGHFALIKKGIASKDHDIAIAIPAAAGNGVEFVIPEKDDRLLIAILDNKTANSLLSYLVQQSYESVAAYSDGTEDKFRDLLRSKMTDPIGAMIGGYGLLALNRLSPLDQWSQNLPAVAPWLPDSYVIHGETHARLAKHEIAAKAFYELTKCGIPLFSVGLSYAESRVRLYAGHGLPDKQAAAEMAAWLGGLYGNVIKRLKVGEVLTTIIDPVRSHD